MKGVGERRNSTVGSLQNQILRVHNVKLSSTVNLSCLFAFYAVQVLCTTMLHYAHVLPGL